MVTAARVVCVIVALAACQGRGASSSDDPARAPGSGSAPARAPDATTGFADPVVAGDAGVAPEDGPRVKLEEPDPLPDPGKQIAELRAMPAWQAVVDRAQLLARRDQHGVVYGRLGAPILEPGPAPAAVEGGAPPDAGLVPSPYVWLVDDTEGNGALGIRVALGSQVAKPGERVAVGGAWELDADRRWFWRATLVQPISQPATPSDLKDPPAPVPSHAIASGPLPPGARTITVARDHDVVYFQLVGPMPVRDGDGWLVADELGDEPFARMTLPGERASYGGQDMRTADERWLLKRGQTYWVRIGRIRRHGPDRPVTVFARTAPVRLN